MAEEIFEMDEAAQEFHEEQEQYKYIAFISYRHLPVDIRVAKAIHTMIETQVSCLSGPGGTLNQLSF